MPCLVTRMTAWTVHGMETPKKVSGGVEGTIRRASDGKGIQVLGARGLCASVSHRPRFSKDRREERAELWAQALFAMGASPLCETGTAFV